LTPGTRVRGCTEHKRYDKFLFRAHPSYRGHNQWHNWETFDWSGGNIEQDDDRVCIPGQIVFFLEVTKKMVGIDVGGEMILPSTGLFGLIESLEDPLPHPGKCSELVVKGRKCLTTKQQKKRRQDGRSVRAPNLYLVPVESIDEPKSAIPILGGDPGDFVFLRPVNTWSDCFSDYIAICHGSLDQRCSLLLYIKRLMFFSCKSGRHVDAFKATIVCTTPIQRILSQLQSMTLSTVEYKISNNGYGMTNTAITTKWNHHESPTMGCFRFLIKFPHPFPGHPFCH
jgi:hypothetical protein